MPIFSEYSIPNMSVWYAAADFVEHEAAALEQDRFQLRERGPFRKTFSVIPAKAGIQAEMACTESGFPLSRE